MNASLPATARDQSALQAELTAALSQIVSDDALLWEREDTTPYECDGLAAYRQVPLAGLVVNRIQRVGAPISAPQARAAVDQLATVQPRSSSADVTEDLLRLHADRAAQAGRQEAAIGRFTASHPTIPQVTVAASAEDVNDVEQLRAIGDQLAD